ncbi:MAG: hypothetical protein M0Z53_10080 [Thermaerobacter sp.]|nr:hypothetical protein [Thermaerobacter sp.]
MSQMTPVSEYPWVQALALVGRSVSAFPRYGVMWPAYSNSAPVIFYALKSSQGYHQLVQHLARHPEWQFSFAWSSRRFYGYQRELSNQGHNWLMYQETKTGWKFADHAQAAVATRSPATRFIPTLS